MRAEIGCIAADRAFAEVTISGTKLNVSDPHILPVRPKPHITSSATKRISYRRKTSWTLWKYVSGGITAPPAPITGSAKKAPIFSPFCI